MDFYFSHTELDTQISEIKRKNQAFDDGVVSDQMKMNGIVYKHNYGVIPYLVSKKLRKCTIQSRFVSKALDAQNQGNHDYVHFASTGRKVPL